ncbi:MAG: class I SAM-dependent methyltransferase [Zoogloea sp.]|nr:MAG: class I SAM-dependent methyltransferase [Zoogloea sp.]
MPSAVSSRILEAIDALPLYEGVRVLEIGCGPGVAAREIVRRYPGAFVLGIDRSSAAIRQAVAGSGPQISLGQLAFRAVAAESFSLRPTDPPFHLAFALRVGAFDGRHPQVGVLALPRIAAVLAPGGRFFIDGGSPLRELPIGDA